jgi:tripartite-type tricarboxylate transporter receptor subunit TctC
MKRKMSKLKILSALLVAATVIAQAGLARSDAYPSRRLTIVLPYPPGTNADTVARLIAEKVSQSLKQPVVIENRPGGATVPGTEQMLQAPPDGYTLLQSGTNTNINTLLGIKPPYDVQRDLSPVALLVTFPGVLVVNPEVSAKSVADLVVAAKSKPNAMSYGSSGVGSIFHLAMEEFQQQSGAQFLHVPFRGLGPALIGIMRNDVQVMIADIPLVLDNIHSGKLRPLAQTGKTRMPQLPDVPTFTEAGMTDYEAAGFLGVWVRAGTPTDELAVLNREINGALASPEVKNYSLTGGMLIAGGSPDDFAKFLAHDRSNWSRVISQAGIKLEQ